MPNWLLIFVPATLALEYLAPDRYLPIFARSGDDDTPKQVPWSMGKALLVLGAASVLIAWSSKILVAAIEPSTRQLGLSNAFVGIFVVAILGNAAEHATAIIMAMKNRMDLSLAIAIGSSVQVALFVAPVLALASLFVGPAAMDLDFPPGLVLVVVLSVLITGQVADDGRSDWFKGVQLLAVYLILGMAFAFLAGDSPH
ncbi:calcium/proton exchanger [Azotobacter chroococcum]|uniref:hypothetical protein n=1 Tax=Azotobacter chroococcum TaxID=353 RepID=UPI001E48C70A|nr:hypothetical protein [Azotobacter chroococcum]